MADNSRSSISLSIIICCPQPRLLYSIGASVLGEIIVLGEDWIESFVVLGISERTEVFLSKEADWGFNLKSKLARILRIMIAPKLNKILLALG